MQFWRQKKIIMVLIMVLSHFNPNGWTNLQQLNFWALSVFIFWVFEFKVDAMGYHECTVYLKSYQKVWINILSLNQTKPRALNIFTNWTENRTTERPWFGVESCSEWLPDYTTLLISVETSVNTRTYWKHKLLRTVKQRQSSRWLFMLPHSKE